MIRRILLLLSCTFLRQSNALSPPVLSPFVPLVMASIPDPILHVTVGTMASGLGSLATIPLESILKAEPVELEKSKETNPLSLCLPQGLQLGIYTALLGTISEPSMLSVMRILSAMVVGGFLGLIRAFELENTLYILQVSITKEALFLMISLPTFHALLLDGMQPFAAGAISGILACLLTSPFRIVEQRIHQDTLLPNPNTKMNAHGHNKNNDNTEVTTIVIDGQPIILPRVLPPPPQKESSSIFYKNKPTAQTSLTDDTGNSWSVSVPMEEELTEAEAKRTLEEIIASWDDPDWSPESTKLDATSRNGNLVDTIVSIAEQEGYNVLFGGSLEQCILAIPRYGTMLAVYDHLQEQMYQAGWIAQQTLHL